MTKFCISQTKYPNKIIIEGDTICQVTIEQLKTANQKFVKLEYCEAISNTLTQQNTIYREIIEKDKEIEVNRQSQIRILQLQKKELDNSVQEYKEDIKNKDKKIKWVKIQRTTFGITTILLVGYEIIDNTINKILHR